MPFCSLPNHKEWYLLLLLISAFYMVTQAMPMQNYRPVILMHGVLTGALDMKELEHRIQGAHPGTAVLNVDAYSYVESGTEMSIQVKGVHNDIKGFINNATDGVNMVCYSQGGLVCRGILEQFSEPKVKTFISLSSPQAGQFGTTDFLKFFFPNYTTEHLYLVAYTELGQEISVANYWNDPHHQDLYKKYNKFLPVINTNTNFRSNFLNLEQLVLIGGPDDGVIQPWQSSHFGFYDENEDIVPMTSQDFYKADSFGLRTLDQQGKVKVYEIPGIEHLEWPLSQEIFEKYIEPWLH